MIICFECSQEIKDLLDRLVSSGHYRDYSEAIALAIANQGLLQSEVKSKGATVSPKGRQEQNVPLAI